MKIIIVSGGFDPLHSGHLDYLINAKSLGGTLVAGVNSDNWLIRKKGAWFLPYKERKRLVGCLCYVDYVLDFDDGDDSARDLIKQTQDHFRGDVPTEFIFANGGDRTEKNIPEMEHTFEFPVKFVFGVGGIFKANSSSAILKRWREIPEGELNLK